MLHTDQGGHHLCPPTRRADGPPSSDVIAERPRTIGRRGPSDAFPMGIMRRRAPDVPGRDRIPTPLPDVPVDMGNPDVPADVAPPMRGQRRPAKRGRRGTRGRCGFWT